MATDIPLLRFMVLSALVGFFVFCASYSILVWKKRRKSSESSTYGSRIRRWSVTAVSLGCLGILTTLVVRETVRAEGIMGGDGLYAVASKPEMRIVQLAEEGPVKEGELLARFTSPEALGEIRQGELTRNQLSDDKENLKLQPLPRDPELVRLHNLAIANRDRLDSKLMNIRQTRDTAVRDALHNINAQLDYLALLDNELKVAEGDYRQAVAKREKAREQLAKERDLATRQNFTTIDLKDREKEVASLDAEINKHEARRKSIEQRQKRCQESITAAEKNSTEQPTRLNAEERKTEIELVAAKQECAELAKQLVAETEVALQRRQGELKSLDNKIAQSEVALQAKHNKIELKAPYDGQVIFRHPSPGLNHGPVLVFSRPEGLRLRFRLPEGQVEALRNAGNVTVELEETANTVEQRFPGKFLQATTLTREPGMALVELECQAPPETVASLAEGKPIKARFSWRPPLLNLWPFPVSVILIGLGLFGFIVSNLSGWRPGWGTATKPVAPVDEEDAVVSFARVPAPKEGDTVEAVADTIPVRPELPGVPREIPIHPWEHPVGIRLRESIIRENLDPLLLDAVEMAIEHQQDAVIVPIREALRRGPTVPEHARRLLDHLNACDSLDEIKQIEQRCLAQRLTFMLYTLGLEIPSQSRPTPLLPTNRIEERVTRI